MTDWRDLNVPVWQSISDTIHSAVTNVTPCVETLQQLAKHLDTTATNLVGGDPNSQWIGLASDAFTSAWDERKSLLQDTSSNLHSGLGDLSTLAKSIDDNTNIIKGDQAAMANPPTSQHHLSRWETQEIENEAQQAMNDLSLALSLFNSQMNDLNNGLALWLDCQDVNPGVPANTFYSNQTYNPYAYAMSKSSGSGIPPKPAGLPSYVSDAHWAALIDDSNPKFQLTPENAALALSDAPPGTASIEVAGAGTAGRDILFKDASGNILGERDVKCPQGQSPPPRPFGTGNVGQQISKGASQVHYHGNVFVQVPTGTDVAYYLQNFQRAPGRDLTKYAQVTITFVDPSGNVLYTGPLAP